MSHYTWDQNFMLIKDDEACGHFQMTTDHHWTSQLQYQATSDRHMPVNHYARHELNDLGPSPSDIFESPVFGVPQPYTRSAAGQSPRNVSSDYPSNASSNYPFDASLGLSYTNFPDSSHIASIQPFHPDTRHHFPEDPHFDHVIHNHKLDRPLDYLWDDDHILYGHPAAESIAQQMGACPFESPEPNQNRLTCKWEGCGRVYRRDTIIRHIREVHLGMSRSKSLAPHTILPRLRRSPKRA